MKPHCWKSNVEEAAEIHGYASEQWGDAMNHPSTCMLLEGHEGPHDFVFDGDILIKLPYRLG